MEPGFHTGDPAVVRSAETYRVGDVVAYRSEMLDTVVVHRVVAVDSGRFTLQGDNNTWLDPERHRPGRAGPEGNRAQGTGGRRRDATSLLVLHWSRSGVETFVLQEHGTTYRYRTGTQQAARPPVDVPADAM